MRRRRKQQQHGVRWRDALLLRVQALRAHGPSAHLPRRPDVQLHPDELPRLVSFPIATDPKEASTPTDAGTASNGSKTWKFTVKDGVKWEDGKAITCEDFKYGASRVFATDVITGGPSYILSYLDVPSGKDGLPTYKGPYKKTGQADFDKAISCSGKTITYKFKKPWPDFNLAVAALHMMDPYRADKDKGDKSNYTVFSNGPYKLE